MRMRKSSLALVFVVIIVAGLAIFVPKEDIIRYCDTDDDCHKTCSGCISKSSSVKQMECPVNLSLCKCVKNSCQYLLNEDEAINVVDDRFPDVEKDANLNMDCGDDPCWEINFSLGNSSGGGGGGAKVSATSGDVISEECNGGICEECDYHRIQNTPWGEIVYYNFGCENPEPTCDLSNTCRGCESQQECVTKNLTSTIRLDIGQILTQHYYYLIGSGISLHYNESDSNCTVYNQGGILYSDILLDIVECEDEFLAHVVCNESCGAI